MVLIECKDGTSEYIDNYKDIIDIVREKIGDNLANTMEREYNFDVLYNRVNDIYEENTETYKKISKSNNIEEIKKQYDNIIFCDIASIL